MTAINTQIEEREIKKSRRGLPRHEKILFLMIRAYILKQASDALQQEKIA